MRSILPETCSVRPSPRSMASGSIGMRLALRALAGGAEAHLEVHRRAARPRSAPRGRARPASPSWNRARSFSHSTVNRGGLDATSSSRRLVGDARAAAAARPRRRARAARPASRRSRRKRSAVSWKARAALQRVQALALLGLQRRLQPQHVLQQVLEAAAGEGGEAAGGDRVGRGDGIEARGDGVGQRVDEPVVGGHAVRPARLRRQVRAEEERAIRTRWRGPPRGRRRARGCGRAPRRRGRRPRRWRPGCPRDTSCPSSTPDSGPARPARRRRRRRTATAAARARCAASARG